MEAKKYIAILDSNDACFGISDNLSDMMEWALRLQMGNSEEFYFRFFNEDDCYNFEEVYAKYNIRNLEQLIKDRVTKQ